MLRELRPYTCTYPECHHRIQLFEDVGSWADHEKEVARSSYYCPDCSDPKKPGYKSAKDLEKHLKSSNRHSLKDRDIRVIMHYAQFGRPEDRDCCPFCLVKTAPSNLTNHMIDHFEKLAMRALDDCKTLGGEEQASIGDVREVNTGRPHTGQQARPSQMDEGGRVHKTLSKSREGIFLLDISWSTFPYVT